MQALVKNHFSQIDPVFSSAGVGTLYIDTMGQISHADGLLLRFPSLQSKSGQSKSGIKIDDFLNSVGSDNRELLAAVLGRAGPPPAQSEIEFSALDFEGKTQHYRLTIGFFEAADTASAGQTQNWACAVLQDVSEQSNANAKARQNMTRLRQYAECASDWFWETDDQHRMVYLSKRFKELTGVCPGVILGKPRTEYVGRIEGKTTWANHLADLDARRPFHELKIWVPGPQTGTSLLVRTSGVPFFDEHSQFRGYRGVGHDITEEFEARERLHFLAENDSLTGLLNRRAFEVRAGSHGKKPSFYLVLLDLDRFKYINDNFGHARGDQLLKAVARRLSDWMPSSAHISRLAGDEFAVSLEFGGSILDVSDLLKAVVAKLGEPYLLSGVMIHAKVSAGFTCQSHGDVDRALLEADVALFAAKQKGGDHVEYFDESKQRAAARRTSLERALRAALERNEFSLHYQPQIDLQSGRLLGAEALLRWNAGTPQMVSPMEFIPLAEEIGIMPDIGRWVLHEAIRQQRRWIDAGLDDLIVAVNVSATQFVHGDVSAMLAQFLEEECVPAHSIELEITESVFMQDQDMVTASMRRVRDMGTSMALDDFGTGYSSLSYLRNFPVDRLKIDQSFIQPIVDEPSALAIVEGIIRLAQSLDLYVVAEGVELAEHAERLNALGCQCAQGYFYAKPLPADQFTQFARDQVKVKTPNPIDVSETS